MPGMAVAPLNDNTPSQYSWDDISSLIFQRRRNDPILLRMMIEVRDRYNGDVVLPYPDLDGEPDLQPPTPRLLADAIDFIAMRAASTKPGIFVPALIPYKVRGKGSRETADLRRKAFHAAWHRSGMELLMRRAFRHLAGYGSACLLVVPDFDEGRAMIQTRDPLSAYPEFRNEDDIREPLNVGFIYGRSPAWIIRHYPEARDYVRETHQGADLWDMVEWIDQNDVVIGILGPRVPVSTGLTPIANFGAGMQLRRWPNKAGRVPAAIPRRVTLNRILSQVHTMVPTLDLFNRLTTLDIVAAEKAIFPDMVLLGKDGRPPQILGGTWHDGRDGEINHVLDADVKVMQSSPGPLTNPTVDRLERAARISMGLPAQAGGESGGAALRTGNALDAMAGYSIDPRVQEAQELMARAMTEVNRGIAAVEKGYFPRRKMTCFSGWTGDPELIEYVPAEVFETDENIVAWSFPGSDMNQITVAISQMVGTGLVSKHSGRIRHPLIDNPEMEGERVVEEKIEEATLMALLQQAQGGQVPLDDVVGILAKFRESGDIVEAIQRQHQESQQRQAQDPGEAGEGETAPPGAMPGLAMPGAGAEQGGQGQPPPPLPAAQPPDNALPSISPPLRAQTDLKALLRAVRAQ